MKSLHHSACISLWKPSLLCVGAAHVPRTICCERCHPFLKGFCFPPLCVFCKYSPSSATMESCMERNKDRQLRNDWDCVCWGRKMRIAGNMGRHGCLSWSCRAVHGKAERKQFLLPCLMLISSRSARLSGALFG